MIIPQEFPYLIVFELNDIFIHLDKSNDNYSTTTCRWYSILELLKNNPGIRVTIPGPF